MQRRKNGRSFCVFLQKEGSILKKKCLQVATLAHTIYKRCECCNRVKDIYFKLSVLDAAQAKYLVGDFDLCRNCGENFGDILNIKISTSETVSNFTFEKV